MKLSIRTAAAALAIVAGFGLGTANAATARGTVTKIEPAKHMLVISGHTYRLPPTMATQSLRKGEKVQVQYHVQNGHRMASAIKTI